MNTKTKLKRFWQNMTLNDWLMPNQGLLRISIIGVLLICSACSRNEVKPLQVTGVPVTMMCPAPLYLPPPKAQNHETVTWKIVTVEGINYAALTMKDYGNLTRNMAEIDRWEEEVAAQVKAYLSQKQTVIRTDP